MSFAVRRRVGALIVLAGTWAIILGCFPVFTPEVNRKSQDLRGTVRDEIDSNKEKLFIIGVQEHAGLRRYRLALTGLLAERAEPSVMEFIHDEATGEVAIVREGKTGPLPLDAQEVRLIRSWDLRRVKDKPDRGQQIAALLTNDGSRPTSAYVEPYQFGKEHLALHFHYRDQQDIIRRANLVVIPRASNQSPVLAELNRLNYLWSVPADVVVVVVGWAIFWPFGAILTSSGGFH